MGLTLPDKITVEFVADSRKSKIINMKDFTLYINEKLKITKDILKQNKYNYHPKSISELKEIIDELIKEREISKWRLHTSRTCYLVNTISNLLKILVYLTS